MGYFLNNHPFDPEDFNAVNRARTQSQRPTCDCKPVGIAMYIAKIGENFYLKRMPDTGSKHAPSCDHYAPPSEISGLGMLLGEAIIRNSANNTTEIKPAFSLKKGSSQAREQTPPSETETVSASKKRLTLAALFDLLWDESGLSHWSPKDKYDRKYKDMREHVLDAVNNKIIRGMNLKDILYMPEVYNIEDKAGIKRRRELVFSRIAGAKDYLIAMGELKSIEPSTHGYKISLKHVPDCGFFIPEKTFLKLMDKFGDIIEQANSSAKEKFDPQARPESKAIIVMTFSVNGFGTASAVEISINRVTSDLIPFDTFQEKILIDALKDEKRAFDKNLRYITTSPRMSRVTLTDTERPTALFISAGQPDEAMENDMKDLKYKHEMDTWVWNIDGHDMPKFPPSRTQARNNVLTVFPEVPEFKTVEPPPQYKFLHDGESIQIGDEYQDSNNQWVVVDEAEFIEILSMNGICYCEGQMAVFRRNLNSSDELVAKSRKILDDMLNSTSFLE